MPVIDGVCTIFWEPPPTGTCFANGLFALPLVAFEPPSVAGPIRKTAARIRMNIHP